jgi:hypothetical protein
MRSLQDLADPLPAYPDHVPDLLQRLRTLAGKPIPQLDDTLVALRQRLRQGLQEVSLGV